MIKRGQIDLNYVTVIKNGLEDVGSYDSFLIFLISLRRSTPEPSLSITVLLQIQINHGLFVIVLFL